MKRLVCVYELQTSLKGSENETSFLGLLQQEAGNSFQPAVSLSVRAEVLMLFKSSFPEYFHSLQKDK